MTPARFAALMDDETLLLTAEELAEGYHFCVEFDGLLMHRGDPGCICGEPA